MLMMSGGRADVLVHRLLATALGLEPFPAYLQDRERMRQMCEVMNHRHHMAQLAGRASVELYTLIYFKCAPHAYPSALPALSRPAPPPPPFPPCALPPSCSLACRDKRVEEDAVVMAVKKNGIRVFVPK
jgi:exoribonuclease R